MIKVYVDSATTIPATSTIFNNGSLENTSLTTEEDKIRDIIEGMDLSEDDSFSFNSTDHSHTDDNSDSMEEIHYSHDEESDDDNDLLYGDSRVELAEMIKKDYVPVHLRIDKQLLSKLSHFKHVVKKPKSYLTLTTIPDLGRSMDESKEGGIFPLVSKPVSPTFKSDEYNDCYNENYPFKAKVLTTECLTSEKALKRTIQVSLDITGLDWKYQPGYAFGIMAPNSDKLVLPLLKRLGLNPEEGFKVSASEKKLCSGLPIELDREYTYYEAFKYFININGVPKKSFLRMLAEYCTEKKDKKQLYFLCATEGARSYRHLKLQYPSLLDILYTFKSCHPPFVAILENSCRISPRYYSITSSPFYNSDIISFMFNVEKYRMPRSEDGECHSRFGHCTGWLDETLEYISIPDCVSNLRSKSIYIPIFPKPVNSFVLPSNSLNKSIIMIGAGTGVAPFISFVEYKRHLLEDGTLDHHVQMNEIEREEEEKKELPRSKTWRLLYGCRSSHKDCLIKNYESIWRHTIENKEIGCIRASLDDLVITTSREGHGPKYIQDAMRLSENGRELIESIKDKDTYIYICGNNSMCKGIHEAFIDNLRTYGHMTAEEAERFIENLILEKRYLRDIWG